MAAIRAAYPGDAVVEDAAVEVAMDRRFDAAAQVAMGVEEPLLIHPDEVLEMMGQSAVEDRALGTTWAIDLRARSCRDCLHPEGRRRNRLPRARGRTTMRRHRRPPKRADPSRPEVALLGRHQAGRLNAGRSRLGKSPEIASRAVSTQARIASSGLPTSVCHATCRRRDRSS